MVVRLYGSDVTEYGENTSNSISISYLVVCGGPSDGLACIVDYAVQSGVGLHEYKYVC